jgi:peptide/nickel transport system ATP-binding protein
METMNSQPLLAVQDLRTYIFTRYGIVRAVDGVSFHLRAGETLGLVGESGSGKSMTALSILRLLPKPAGKIVGGQILFQDRDLVQMPEREFARWRGSKVALILQDPMTALNPVLTIGYQVGEGPRLHAGLKGKRLLGDVLRLLNLVRIPAAKLRIREYPHQMSGGMRQRIVTAMAISAGPRLLIADEPTSALDVTTQVSILELLKEIQRQFGLAMLLITHDFGIVNRTCDRVAVMYAGRLAKTGSLKEVAVPEPDLSAKESPRPWCRWGLDTPPTAGTSKDSHMTALLTLTAIQKYYPVRRGLVFGRRVGYIQAVDGISCTVPEHKTYGLVGESGCGKTTVAKCILLLEKPTGGHIELDGMDASNLRGQELRRYRRTVQGVFQDPFSSLNPRMHIRDILREPLRVHMKLSKKEQAERVKELLRAVELSPHAGDLFPHEFSGGQRQRMAVARALALSPKLIVLDEPVSALNVSIRAQVMNLLRDLQQEHGLSYFLIAHDLAVVRYMSHRISVMYLGKLVEEGSSDEIATNLWVPKSRRNHKLAGWRLCHHTARRS